MSKQLLAFGCQKLVAGHGANRANLSRKSRESNENVLVLRSSVGGALKHPFDDGKAIVP